MSRTGAGYHQFRVQRAALLAADSVCRYCGGRADTADHVPELASFPPGLWVGVLVPACRSCNSSRGASFGNRRRGAAKGSRQW